MKKILKKFTPKPSVSVIRLSGVIGAGSRVGGPGLNDAALASVIERAFAKGKPKAIALVINSPGGSPTQSSLISARIRRLADEKGLKVYAFCEDVAASGGYWLASTADEIYVDDSTIIGSIGVISASFGFHELMQRQGVERRVYTAGEDKSMLDPFRPEKAEDVTRVKALQKVIHDNFITQITTRRGDRLKGDDLFTGEVWVGAQAVENGLADGVAHLVPKMKELFGDDVRLAVHSPKRSLFSKFGAPAAASVIYDVEDRLNWSRFGL
ncbi:MAG: S49 family peptidase [Alphaproteobacteria bacterium]